MPRGRFRPPGSPSQLVWATPFALLLPAVAVFPVVPVAHHWWERNAVKLAVGLALGGLVLGHYRRGLRGRRGPGLADGRRGPRHAILREYVPFMVLLVSLYVISGGLQVRATSAPCPR